MATITAIRDAIGTALETLTGMRVAQEFGDQINVSGSACVAIVQKGNFTYDSVMGQGGEALNFSIVILAGKASDRVARDKLDALCDPSYDSTTSVRSAVNGTLTSLVAWCTVTADSEYREYPIGDGDAAPRYLGVEVTVTVGT